MLPRKRVFIIHAVLLTAYLLCNTIMIVIDSVIYGGDCFGTCLDIFYSIKDIIFTIACACEVTTFAYVVYSQISFTGK